MKSKILKLTLLSLIVSHPYYALSLDIVTAPVQVFTQPCDNYLRYEYASAFCFTQKLTYGLVGKGRGHGEFGVFAYVIALPFTLLNEDAEQMTLDTNSLMAQGYTEEDINNYKNDIELIERESEIRKVSSSEMAKILFQDLVSEKQISHTTIEILGL